MNKAIKLLSTWFGLGDINKMPGTFGTLGAIPLVLILGIIGNDNFYWIFLVAFFLFSAYISGKAEKMFGEKDCQKIVIDEVLGFLTTMFLVEISAFSLGVGFILFRFFDITKLYPINKIQEIKGGLGVVVDDFLAGVYANVVLYIILLVMSYYA